MAAGFLPKKAAADAMHIAFAAVYGMDYLLTWNCRHINNIETIWQVEKVCSKRFSNSPRGNFLGVFFCKILFWEIRGGAPDRPPVKN